LIRSDDQIIVVWSGLPSFHFKFVEAQSSRICWVWNKTELSNLLHNIFHGTQLVTLYLVDCMLLLVVRLDVI